MPMPTREQIARQIRRYYSLTDQGEIPTVIALFAPGATYCRPGYPPLVGRDRLAVFYHSQRVIDYGIHTVSQLVIDGHTAAVEGEFEGTLRDGMAVALRFADFFEVNEDLLFEVRNTYFFTPLV
ncbi:nuclear transport factor 2 family protein [Catenulispora rubra]|uniref:nuclear transport factor 2 family protein n=1 Tax=Catenulispora rubra TaxID=280293 RepID=UPI001E5AF204|nr:nuclear transport factor 2 family protein [Catenulispora rubra]